MTCRTLVLVVLCGLILVACSGNRRTMKHVAELYAADAERAQNRSSTIVFVPGIMGSELTMIADESFLNHSLYLLLEAPGSRTASESAVISEPSKPHRENRPE